MADPSSSSIPERPSDITASWLEATLGARDGSLTDFEVTRIGEGQGIVGIIVRATLQWKEGGASLPESVVVKLGTEDAAVRARPAYRVITGREVCFYNELAGDCGVRTPNVHSAQFDDYSGASAIVMEDLGHATIYQTGTAPAEAIVAVGRHIARLHARWWNDPRLAAMDWLNSPDTVTNLYTANARAAVPSVLPWLEANAPDMAELALLRLEVAERGVTPALSLPPTLAHADLGLKNVAFVGEEPVLFDWALASRTAAPVDLVTLVSESYGASVPYGLAQAVLPVYFEALCAMGVSGVSYEQVQQDFGTALMFRLWSPLILLGLNQDVSRQKIALRWMETCRAFKDEFDFEGRLRRALR